MPVTSMQETKERTLRKATCKNVSNDRYNEEKISRVRRSMKDTQIDWSGKTSPKR